MSLADVLAADRRLTMLQALAEAERYHLNELVLRQALAHIGHDTSREMVRADILFLVEHGLTRREEIDAGSGPLWLVTLTDEGSRVAAGKAHPGVARPGPG
jgi:hypothetical protein